MGNRSSRERPQWSSRSQTDAISPELKMNRASGRDLRGGMDAYRGLRGVCAAKGAQPMAVSSMTGFARAAGSSGGWRWAFEIKSVNAKGLDLRLRMPAPFDRVEAEARARLGKALARGTCFATLARPARGRGDHAPRIDQAALDIDRRRRARRGREGGTRAADHGRTSRLARRRRDRRRRRTTRRRSPRPAPARSGASTRRSPRSPRCAAGRGRGAGRRAARTARRDRSADARRRRQSGPPAGGGPRAARRERRGADGLRRAASTRTGCIRRRSCSPPRPTSARSSTG